MIITHQPNITPREKEVLLLVCKGKTAKQVGHELGISSSTVEAYKKSLCVKFHVRNSVQLAVMAAELGYVSGRDLEIQYV